MGKLIEKLSSIQVRSLGPGMHSDGGNLYLKVRDRGSKSWVFRYKRGARTKELGLGSVNSRSLKEARRLSERMRHLVLVNQDPATAIPKRKKEVPVTFRNVAFDYISKMSPSWKNKKHQQQWGNTLDQYVFPVMGELHPSEIKLVHILKILEPIWLLKPETAKRVQGRIERILDMAYVMGYRTEQNPAKYKGILDKVLPSRTALKGVTRHPAVPYKQLPKLVDHLKTKNTNSANCLLFLILTAARSGEARAASWSEIDFNESVWTIPADRMKAAREHRVPLSQIVVGLLKNLPRELGNDLLFPSLRGKILSDSAVSKVLKELGVQGTVHGMRSSFREWAAEQTNYPRELCELSLAHVNRNRVEAAYQRSDLLEKRRGLMVDWVSFLKLDNDSVENS